MFSDGDLAWDPQCVHTMITFWGTNKHEGWFVLMCWQSESALLSVHLDIEHLRQIPVPVIQTPKTCQYGTELYLDSTRCHWVKYIPSLAEYVKWIISTACHKYMLWGRKIHFFSMIMMLLPLSGSCYRTLQEIHA